MSEVGVSDKEAKKEQQWWCWVRCEVKLQSLEAFLSKAMMMTVHQNHHHRPLVSAFHNDSCAAAGDGHGPTAYTSTTNHIIINDVVISGASASGGAVHSDGAAPVRPLQPFDISNSISATTTSTTLKSPAAGRMAASLGFPFTSAQWRELERQAMIYKYMMASVPIPPDLLIPTSLPAASRSPLDSGINLRLSSGTDPEPGRCRRTDGKKWRCSRDVAPNHKYCERHMHRGRPRSRKHVEVHASSNNSTSSNDNQLIKRARHDYYPFASPAVTVASSNPTIRKDVPSSQFLASTTSQPYLESSLYLDKFGGKAASFDPVCSVSSDKEPSGLEWMLKGDPVSMAGSNREWTALMQEKVGLTTYSCCNNTAISSPNYDDSLYLNSYGIFSSGLDQQSRRCPPSFFNTLVVPLENPVSQKPRGFIDAWSIAETEANNANANDKTSVTSNGKLSLSSLDLSMGGGGSVDREMGAFQMGLGLIEVDGNARSNNGSKTHVANWLAPAPWMGSTPGGPLAEVLRPSTVATTNEAPSNPSSPVITNAESDSPLATMVSSPSGVLQKTFASLSDGSSNSSPTVANSKTNSETGLLWSSKAN